MKQYLDLLNKIITEGVEKKGARENMPSTLSIFGHQMEFDLSKGFPIITTKEINFNNIINELFWFLDGNINIKYLIDFKTNIWNEDSYNYYVKIASKNTDETWNNIYLDNHDGTIRMFLFDEFVHLIKNKTEKELKNNYSTNGYTLGDCGKQYGWLWRNLDNGNGVIDQLKNVLESLEKTPLSRRHIISAWNVDSLNEMALPACHSFVQFNCRPLSFENKIQWVLNNTDVELENLAITERCYGSDVPNYYLDCQLYQRSGDAFLGVPYNISSYALLTYIFSLKLNMLPGNFIHTLGDVHIYSNHIEQVKEQLKREPKDLPHIEINKALFDLENNIITDLNYIYDKNIINLDKYNYHPKIKGKVSTGLKL